MSSIGGAAQNIVDRPQTAILSVCIDFVTKTFGRVDMILFCDMTRVVG